MRAYHKHGVCKKHSRFWNFPPFDFSKMWCSMSPQGWISFASVGGSASRRPRGFDREAPYNEWEEKWNPVGNMGAAG